MLSFSCQLIQCVLFLPLAEYDEDDISAQIGQIFGYDRTKYGRESEYELSKMDASYKDIEKEEKKR